MSATGGRFRLPIRRARFMWTFWRRSVQARVVVSTLVLSTVVITLVGWVLLRQVSDGLVDEKTTSSVA
jgi:two-component system sensor histidine kinase MtrB